ncbi:SMP-30/gluconolactonase/LRE family protein [Paenibacillus sp. P25]|nr:SMP-30/gluconolactonase/LRE family protein [Paenibacillus sp. P25]
MDGGGRVCFLPDDACSGRPSRGGLGQIGYVRAGGRQASGVRFPKLIGGQQLVCALRDGGQGAGAAAQWDAEAGKLSVTKDSNVLELALHSTSYKVNGLEQSTATPLQNWNGNILVPVRLLFETFGYQIGYDAPSRTVSLKSADAAPSLKVFGISPGGYSDGKELKVSVFAYNYALRDFAQAKEPKTGEGHIHVWLDSDQLDPQSALKVFKSEPMVFKDLKPGKHTLTVQLVGNDHKPIQPEVKQSIEFHTVDLSILKDLDPEKRAGMRIEGVIADSKHRVFTVDMDSKKLYRIAADSGKQDVLTELPRSATGMAFDASGNLYIASGGQEGVIFKVSAKELEGDSFDPGLVETYASGVQGANGLTFDAKGNLYVSGGANGNIYKVAPDGKVETYKSGLAPLRQEQLIVVNGLAFGQDGKLYVANTSSGEVRRFAVNPDGSLGASELVAKSPPLYGADGLTFGPAGALYIAANERNAIVRVSTDGQVTEVAHNSNQGPLEFPASLYFAGTTLYISNFDQPRGANKPNEPGIGASIAKIEFGDGK